LSRSNHHKNDTADEQEYHFGKLFNEQAPGILVTAIMQSKICCL